MLTRRFIPFALVLVSQAATVDPSYLKLLEWRSIGPSRGGRVLAVAGDVKNKFTFYMGATGGGVWKTEDGGITWRNISDGYFKTGSVGAIAVSQSDPQVVYVGMGEAAFRGDASHGDGVYKSVDGGRTWANVGLGATRHISRIRIHPTNPDIAYVAAFGDGFGPNPERGVYKTTDGGKNWRRVLYRDEKSGAADLTLQDSDPRVLYASLIEFRRYPWANRSGGDGSGLFKSVDGGETWKEISGNPGLPDGPKGRIGLTQSPVKPERVWAIIDAATGKKGVFRTDDAGATWTRVSDYAELTQRPWYYHQIFADPKDANTVYVLNIGAFKSTDGGVTYAPVRTPHGDNHDLWIDPNDPQRMIEGNDGGACVSFNGGRSWSTLYNQPTAQIYHVVADNQFPYRVYGAQQDNSSISLPSRSDFGSITYQDWWSPANSESGYLAVNTVDPNVLYVGDHHWLYRYDHKNNQTRDISPNPETHYGWGAREINFRFQWTFPVMTSPHDPKVIYTTSQYVHKSTNEGQSWQLISPDLTRHDPDKLEPTPDYLHPEIGKYWGPITRDNTGVEWYSTIFAFAESPVKKDLLWAGSDDGYIQISRDGGKHWKNVTPKAGLLPEYALISIIDPGHQDAGTAYVAATRYKLQDRKPYLLKTTDYGETWSLITDGIPDGDFTRVIREDPGRRGLLYAGTETSVYVSFDDGAHWQSLKLNLPPVPVHDLLVHRDSRGLAYDLIAATHGRGFYIIDNVNLLQQMDQKPVLVKENPTVRFRIDNSSTLRGDGSGGDSGIEGTNPPRGAVFHYYLNEKPKGPVKITIADKQGKVVRSWSSADAEEAGARRGGRGGGANSRVTAEAGPNRFTWNMQYPAARVIAGTTLHGPPIAPVAASGEYAVTLEVDGKSYTEKFRIATDPRVGYSDGQLAEQFSFLMAVRDKQAEVHDVVRAIRDARKKAEDAAKGTAAVEAFAAKLYSIEERLTQYRARAGQDLSNFPSGIDNKLGTLASLASKGDAPPTDGALHLFGELSKQVASLKAEAEKAIKDWSAQH